MPEDIAIQEWANEVEDLSDEDKQTLSKFDSSLKAHQGGAHAIRMSGSPDRTITNLETMDVEKLDDKQRESLHKHIARIQAVPDGPQGYNIVRPEQMPDGLPYDEDFENWFRGQAHAARAPQGLVSGLVQAWNKRQFEAHETNEREARENEEKFRGKLGEDESTRQLGKANDPNKIGTIKTCLLQASKDLGLDYKDGDGFPQSHLIDCLEMRRKDGAIGDKIPVVKFVAWVWDKFMAEGATEGGEAPSGKPTGDKARIAQNKKDFPKTTFMHG